MESGLDRQLDVEPSVFFGLLIVDFSQTDVVLDDDVLLDHQVQVIGLAEFREPFLQQFFKESSQVPSEYVFGNVNPEVYAFGPYVVFEFAADGQEPRVVAANDLKL